MHRLSAQDRYAELLAPSGSNRLALYRPVPFHENSGRVGDIGFFDEQGRFMWLANAFQVEVLPNHASVSSLTSPVP